MATILIPFYGKPQLMIDCIRHVHAADEARNHLLLVDDGSSKEDRARIDQFLGSLGREVEIITHPRNRGYKEAIITGMSRVRDEIVILLNNDTIVPAGFDLKLLAGFKENERVRGVAPVSNHPTDLFQYREELGIVGEARSLNKETLEMLFKQKNEEVPSYTEVPYLTGMCLALEVAFVLNAGIFSEAYEHGYFEDLALCCKIREKGYQLLIREDCFVYHMGHATYREKVQEEKHRIILKNFELFCSEWGHLSSHPELLEKMKFAGEADPI